jgi:hypothetical protein
MVIVRGVCGSRVRNRTVPRPVDSVSSPWGGANSDTCRLWSASRRSSCACGISRSRFADLAKMCAHYFGPARQRGTSHQVYRMPWSGDPRANTQNDPGRAKAYQVRQVLAAIEKLEEQRRTVRNTRPTVSGGRRRTRPVSGPLPSFRPCPGSLRRVRKHSKVFVGSRPTRWRTWPPQVKSHHRRSGNVCTRGSFRSVFPGTAPAARDRGRGPAEPAGSGRAGGGQCVTSTT